MKIIHTLSTCKYLLVSNNHVLNQYVSFSNSYPLMWSWQKEKLQRYYHHLMYIINFSLRSLRSSFFEERHSHHYYFLKYSPHTFHELSSPRTLRNVLSNSMLEQRDVQVSQSWQGREEKLKLRLSRGIPRRFRSSLRILTTLSPNLEISLRSNASLVTQSRTPWKHTCRPRTSVGIGVVAGPIFRIPRDRQFVTRYFAERSRPITTG